MALKDFIHEHGTLLDGKRGKVKCHYCDKVMSSGFYRLRYHLAGIRGDVASCKNVPTHVKDVCVNEILEKREKSAKEDEELHTPLKRKRVFTEGSTSGTKILEGEIKIGCSILLEERVDPLNRTIVNVFVDNSKDTKPLRSFIISGLNGNVDEVVRICDKAIEEVGIKNVIQIITYSTRDFMKEACKRVTDKHKTVFWTVSASHCLELMLNRILALDLFKNTLDKTKSLITFIYPDDAWSTPFLALENMVNEEKSVKKFFNSLDWNNSAWTGTTKGKYLSNLVADQSFWNRAKMVINAAMPIVEAREFLNDKNKATIGFIYEKLDQVKEEIKENFESKESLYLPLWEAIDEIWNSDLHSPLHSAGYFLNPCFFYSSSFFCDYEVISGLFTCVTKMTENQNDIHLILQQLDEYRLKKGAFGEGSLPENLCSLSPVTWWLKYGGQFPQLQRVSVRILSQTCNGVSKSNLKWNL